MHRAGAALSDAARGAREPVLAPSWRARTHAAQVAVLPSGGVAVSCPAPFGGGGLGRHLQEIAGALERRGADLVCLCEGGASAEDTARCREVSVGAPARALIAGARRSHAWRIWAASIAFDTAAARALPHAQHLIAFNGTALAQLRAARAARFESLALMSANPHMRHVLRQHAIAHSRYPLEPQWATRLLARNLREYAMADRIYVSSHYIWQSFADEGFAEDRLSLFPLTPHQRFQPLERAPESERFEIVYVGALTVHKGVPLLLDALRLLPFSDLRVTLVGGWKTRGMRRFIEREASRDDRIAVQHGDPLPHLRRAALCVHPAFEDGFAYAPAEALACGVPVVVSEDTGMKELITSERDGLVVQTGALDALTEVIEAAYQRELFADRATRPAQ